MAGRFALFVVLIALLACHQKATPPPAPAPDACCDAPPAAGARDGVVHLPDAHHFAGKHVVVLYATSVLGEYDAHPLGGLARRATIASEARAGSDAVIHLDAGDALWPRLAPCGAALCPAGLFPADAAAPAAPTLARPDRGELERRGRLMLAGLARAGVQALVPGESDLHLGPAWLRAEAKKAGLALVAANVTERGRPWPTERFIAPDVGVFGLLTLAPDDLAAAAKQGIAVSDPAAAARAAVSALRARGARVVIGLWHLAGGEEEARTLAREAPGVDIAILGHGDRTLDVSEGQTRLLAAHDRGTYLGRADVDLADGAPFIENRIVRVEPTIGAEPAIAALVKAYVVESRRRLEKKLPTGLSPAQPPPAPPPKTWTAPIENWTYGSNGACNLCHPPVMDQWRTTAHAYGLQTLERKGRQRDPYCLGCHATAFQRAGGTRSLETALTYFADVGCESCHGPSVNHVRSQKKDGTVRQVPEAVCRECHRPDQSAQPFDYKDALTRVLGPAHGKPPR
jgi:hypothetical protein